MIRNAFHCSGHKTQLQFNDIYGYFRKTKTPGLPQWLENDDATPRSKDTNDINYTSCKYRTVRSEPQSGGTANTFFGTDSKSEREKNLWKDHW